MSAKRKLNYDDSYLKKIKYEIGFNENTSVPILPREIYGVILGKLPLGEFARAARACKYFNNVFRSAVVNLDTVPESSFPNCLTRSAVYVRIGTRDIAGIAKEVSQRSPLITTLDATESIITDEDLAVLSERCHEIRNISLDSCLCITAECIRHISLGFPNLEKLDLSRCQLNDTDEGLKYLANACPGLASLKLHQHYFVTNLGLSYIPRGHPSLTNIDLSKCYQITDTGLQFLSHSLTNNTSWNYKVFSGEGLQSLSEGCHSLTKINLTDCSQITDEGLRFLSKGCPSLTNIMLRDCTGVTDEGLRALSNGCPSLTNIYLSWCRAITDKGLQFLSKGCPSLTNIMLRDLPEITDEGLRALSKGCPSLTNIILRDLPEITDEGLRALSEGCPSLTNIDLSWCNKITEV